MRNLFFPIFLFFWLGLAAGSAAERPRLREFGIKTGALQPGPSMPSLTSWA
jgi:hypothetical protein